MSATKAKPESNRTIRETGVFVSDSGDNRNWTNRILIGTPSRGTVRIEWHAAMQSLMIPANWSNGWFTHILDSCYPIRYTVAHGQNVIVRFFIEGNYEWLLFLEDDVIPPWNLYSLLDKYLRDGPPIVSGLYFQKSHPSEPLIYRGRGNGSFMDFKPGDKIWADGVPTGCLLIHRSILELMWNESREYTVAGEKLREVFLSPMAAVIDGQGNFWATSGTSDLEWCRRVIADDILKRAGWPKIARKRFPFLVDTELACKHIAPDGTCWPP